MTLSVGDKLNMPKMALDRYYDYVNVKRRTEGALNDLNEPAITWAAVSGMSNVKADIQPAESMGSQLKQLLAGLEVSSTHMVFFLSTADVAVDDKIEADADGDTAVDTYYRVDAVHDWGSHITAFCTKVDE